MEKMLEDYKNKLILINKMKDLGYNSERDEGYFSGQVNVTEEIISDLEKLIKLSKLN